MAGYFIVVVVASIVVTALFSRLRRDTMSRRPTAEEDAAFENRLEQIVSRDE